MRGQAAPADCAGEAELIEQLGLVVGNAARENLALPGICGSFEALQLLQRFQQPALAEELRAGRDVLPSEDPVHELGGRYGGDLLAQLAERQAMNAGEEAALAPFELMRGGMREVAAEDCAAGFEAKQEFLDVGCGEAENVCQRGYGDGAAVRHPAGQHGEASVVQGSGGGFEVRELALKECGRENPREGLCALGGDPVHRTSNAGLTGAAGADELVEVGAPCCARVLELF